MLQDRHGNQADPVFRKFPKGYAAFVEELPGAYTQGATMEEARANLQEAVAMVCKRTATWRALNESEYTAGDHHEKWQTGFRDSPNQGVSGNVGAA